MENKSLVQQIRQNNTEKIVTQNISPVLPDKGTIQKKRFEPKDLVDAVWICLTETLPVHQSNKTCPKLLPQFQQALGQLNL